MACIKKYFAPNGEPSILYEDLANRYGEPRAEQIYLSTHTESFKEWFGDWEKGKTHGLDANGEPQIYWHGTNQNNIKEFSREGNYFTSDFESAQDYAGEKSREEGGSKELYPVFLNITQKLIDDGAIKILADQIVVRNWANSNIKSVFNEGSFSRNNSKIFAQKLTPAEIARNLVESSTKISDPTAEGYAVGGINVSRVSTVVNEQVPYTGTDESAKNYLESGTRYHNFVEDIINGMNDTDIAAKHGSIEPYEKGFLNSARVFIDGLRSQDQEGWLYLSLK